MYWPDDYLNRLIKTHHCEHKSMFQTNLEEIEGQNNNKIVGVPENKTWFKKCRNQARHT